MNILFIHQNCPGQFKYLAPQLASTPGNRVVFITRPGKPALPGVEKIEYRPARDPSPSTHRYLRLMEEGVLNGQAVARVAQQLKDKHFHPDLVIAHMGWGEALYVKTIWPRTKLLGYFEWYYHPTGADVGFDPREQPTLDTHCRIQSRNGLHLLNLLAADWGMTPTHWQWQQHPPELRHKLSVIHDGIDTHRVAPNPQVTGRLSADLSLRAGEEIVTYVARSLEPYRGFPSFMRAAELILKRRPNCRILVVGGDNVSYGRALPDGQAYREKMLAETDVDPARIHFLGKIPYAGYLRVLQLSAVHIYLTVPFVLSWSMLEAMSAGCLVIGSRTPPVEEVIKDGQNGLLVDFFSAEEIADRVDQVLDHPNRMQKLRDAARKTVIQRYSLESCLKRQIRLIEQMTRPATTVSRPSMDHTTRARRSAAKKHQTL